MSEFTDAMMLFGMSIELRDDRGARLVMSRSANKKPLVAWAVTLLELHGFTTQVCSVASGVMTYKTTENIFLKAAYRRWYDHGSRVTPLDVRICDNTLATWGVEALFDAPEGDVVLRAPRMSDVVASRLAAQVQVFGFNALPIRRGEQYNLCIPASQRAEFENWMCAYVPRAVWSAHADKA